MAKKKMQFPNKTRNNIITAAVVSAGAILLIALVALYIQSLNYVIKIDGKPVTKGSFILTLYLTRSEWENYYGSNTILQQQDSNGRYYAEYAMDDGLNRAMQQKVAANEFNNRKLSLTKEQKDEAKQYRDDLVANASKAMLNHIGMSNGQILKFWEEYMMYSALYDDITKEYVFDAADYEIYYYDTLAEYDKSIREYNVNYIVVDSRQTAEEVQAKIKNGGDIFELIKEYSTEYAAPEDGEDDPWAEPMDVHVIALLGDYVDDIYTLVAGDCVIYPPVEAVDPDATDEADDTDDTDETEPPNDVCIVVYVDNIVVPEGQDKEDMDEYIKSMYISEKKNAIFDPVFQKIYDDAKKTDINDKALKRINIVTMPR